MRINSNALSSVQACLIPTERKSASMRLIGAANGIYRGDVKPTLSKLAIDRGADSKLCFTNRQRCFTNRQPFLYQLAKQEPTYRIDCNNSGYATIFRNFALVFQAAKNSDKVVKQAEKHHNNVHLATNPIISYTNAQQTISAHSKTSPLLCANGLPAIGFSRKTKQLAASKRTDLSGNPVLGALFSEFVSHIDIQRIPQ